MELTDRQVREREFYQEFVKRSGTVPQVGFAPVDGTERRPWNPYWRVFSLVAREFLARGANARLLDIGCGPGIAAARYARIGYEVHGFDITEGNVEVARRVASRYGFGRRCSFTTGAAERMPYPDGHFDVAAGIDILHHVEVPAAISECRRVLKPGGVAVFKEPIEVPALDAIRNLTVVRKWVPKSRSLDRHITEDERKLNRNDIAAIRRIFPRIEMRRFLMLARLDRFLRPASSPKPSAFERIDYALARAVPGYELLGGSVLLILTRD
jgi:2-polyprenyl-3-methyl-5-hydroxy-6-metoxy-1,4-benzoquinol methylase